MGQKVHPYGFRIGFNKTWRSRWYAEKKYAELLHEDLKLRKRAQEASWVTPGVSAIEIERAANKLKVNILTSRPGIIIGRKGVEVDRLKDDIASGPTATCSSIFSRSTSPRSTPSWSAESIAMQLLKRIAFRRAMRKAVESAQRFGAKGIKVRVSGRLGGREIARSRVVPGGAASAAHPARRRGLRFRRGVGRPTGDRRQGLDLSRRVARVPPQTNGPHARRYPPRREESRFRC